MNFTDLLLADRVRLIHDTRNINLVYDILAKYLPGKSYDEIKSLYSLRGDFIKNRIFISSTDTEAIVNLLNITMRLGLEYESITNFELRADLYKFINTVI